MTTDLEIRTLSDDDLLQDIAGRAAPAPNQVQAWIIAQGYYPGQTREPARQLYQLFRAWALAQGYQPVTHVAVWGQIMAMRFKRGRGRHGNFYYISRESVPDVPENGAGTHPVGPHDIIEK